MGKYFKFAINIPWVIYIIARWVSIAWIENYITPALEEFSKWSGIPMLLVEGVIIGAFLVGSVWWFWSGIKGKNQKTNEIGYVDKVIVDSKSSELLALPNALSELSELDYETYKKLSLIKRSDSVLTTIQSQLRKDWNVKPSEALENVEPEIVRATVQKTIKNLKLETKELSENTMMFLLHAAGILDDHHIGISEYRESDERYSNMNKLKAKVQKSELRDAIRMYNWYSLGICSMLLLIAYFPQNSVQSIQTALGKTSTELHAEREDTLSYIMVKINTLIIEELHDK